MDERLKFRLVRCPKCQNLLTELPELSVYQCGGCGAVLRAKKKVPLGGGGMSEKPGKGGDEEGSEKLNGFSEKERGGLADASKAERERDEGALYGWRKDRLLTERTVNFVTKSPLSRTEMKGGGRLCKTSKAESEPDGVTLHGRRKDQAFRARTVSFASSGLPKTDNKEVLSNKGARNVKEHDRGYQSAAEKGAKGQSTSYNWLLRDVYDKNMNRSESVNSVRDKGFGQIAGQCRSPAGSLKSRMFVDQWGLERDGLGGGNLRNHSKFQAFAHADEGPSRYHVVSSPHGHVKRVGDQSWSDSPSRIGYSELNRAELLKKLSEMQEQLNAVHVTGEIKRERVPVNGKTAPLDAYRNRAAFNVSMQPSTPDKHALKHPYVKQFGHRLVHSTSHSPNAIPAYNDSFPPQLPRTRSHELPHEYFMRRHMDFSQEQLPSYASDTFYHNPACSCIHCDKNSNAPSQVPPTVFGNRKFPDAPSDSNLYHQTSPTMFRRQSCNPPSLLSRGSKPHATWPVDIDSDLDGLHQRRPRRSVVSHRNPCFSHPIAGGAPFIACYSCFEILKLPRKVKSREKIHQKVRCGACSKIFLLEIVNKRVVVSLPAEKDQLSAQFDGDCREFSKEVLSTANGKLNSSGVNCSNYSDSPECETRLVDSKDNTPSDEQRANATESEKRQVGTPSSVYLEEKESLDSTLVHQHVSYCAELPAEDDMSSTFEVSPSQENLDDVSSNNALEKSKDKWIDQEKVIVAKSTSRQNSVKDISVETKVEVPPTEFLHTSFSQGPEWMDQEKVTVDKSTSWQNSVKDVSVETEVEVPPSDYLHTSFSQDPEWMDQEKIIVDKSTSWQNSVKDVSVETEVEVPPSEYLHTSFSQYPEWMDQEKIIVDKSTSRQNSVDDISVETDVEASSTQYLHTSFSQDPEWMDQENVIVDKTTSPRSPVEDVSGAIEVEVPTSEYHHTSFSQDSMDVSKELTSSPSSNKGNGSFFVALIKKSIRDFSKSNQVMGSEKSNTFVNGKSIPAHMVKKAEKFAGPIQPGDYWYDIQAGFWGVMGGPCLGIIPPFIQEFNHPMPETCSAGDTGVFVNGRELHQRDLEVLSSRGLPTTRDKFYIVEISGKVLDEDTGKELKPLGKLAPTVEKLKQGFGMRVMKNLA